MAWGSGTYTRVGGTTHWVDDKNAAINIVASRHDTNDEDIATGINQCINKDGSNAFTGNANLGSKKLTAVADATLRSDAPNLGNVQDSLGVGVTTVGGTGDVITLTPSPAITAYSAHQTFRFVVAAINTTTVTINVSGLGAKSLFKYGTVALAAGDLTVGTEVQITYDGTQFQWAAPIPAMQQRAKVADSTRISTTTLTDDAELAGIALVATAVYAVDMFLIFDGTTTAGMGIKVNVFYSGTVTGVPEGAVSGNLIDALSMLITTVSGTSTASNATVSTTTGGNVLAFRGTIRTTGAGNLSMQFAQNSSTANNLNMRIGSYLKVQRLA